MYVTKQIQISETHKMNAYFESLCKNANNLYNVTCFYMRQYATAKYAFEEMKPLFKHQMEIYNLVEETTINTKFHPKENEWVGYVIEIKGIRYYIAGDTDITEENKKVKCDVHGFF